MRRYYQLLFLLPFFVFAQHQKNVDFTHIKAQIEPMPETKEIKGRGVYTFELLEKTDSIFLDAIGMDFHKVVLNGKEIQHINTGKQLAIEAPEEIGTHTLDLWFTSKPKQTVYFSGWDDDIKGNEQIWTQGQGKYTSHWLPSFDDMTEKLEVDLSIVTGMGFQVLANGSLKSLDTVNEYHRRWHYDMTNPMSSYLAAFVIGDFDKKTIKSNSGIPIELYYEPKDSSKVEPTYRHTKEIFDFLEAEIGVPYPWQNYKQVPVHDFLYAGMENTTLTIFSNRYVIDSTAFVDKNYVNVNAHELAHQWFGDLVTEENGQHHWLHEGFATYYAYLAEKQLFGDEYFYWRLFDTAKTLHNLSENDDGEALTNPNANSLTFYEKGAWALVMLRNLVGDEAFKSGIANYLRLYSFKNVTIAKFLAEIEKTSGKDLSDFRKKWLKDEEFPWEEAKGYLTKNAESIKDYLEYDETVNPLNKKIKTYHLTDSPELKRRLILDEGKRFPSGMLKKILLEEKDVRVRQAVANVFDTIPEELKAPFESLLQDKSYVTQEAALFKLWSNFPSERKNYLKQTEDLVGLPNKNIRLLWLTLALVTPDISPQNKQAYFQELNGYTYPHHHFEIRQMAFQYLHSINALHDTALVNLIDAADHHVWQFKKFSRNLVRKLMADEQMSQRFKGVYNALSKDMKIIFDELTE